MGGVVVWCGTLLVPPWVTVTMIAWLVRGRCTTSSVTLRLVCAYCCSSLCDYILYELCADATVLFSFAKTHPHIGTDAAARRDSNRSTVLYLVIYFTRELAPRENSVKILVLDLSRTNAAEASWVSLQACWRLIASNERPTQVDCQLHLWCGRC